LAEKLQSVFSKDQIELLARRSGFLKRKSKLDPINFLQMLLFDQLQIEQPSLQQHSFSLLNDKKTLISKQGIDSRFNSQSTEFLKLLFEQYLNHHLPASSLASGLTDHFSAIRIMDSTEFALPVTMAKDFPGFDGDGTAACAQVQLEYDILSGTIHQLAFENARVSDVAYAVKSNSTLQPGELVLRDLGYYTLNMYREILEQQAFFVSRIKTQVKIYQEESGSLNELSHRDILNKLLATNDKYVDMEVLIGKENSIPVRLIANLLDEEAINRRVRRKQVRKGKLNSSDDLWTRVNVIITNVGKEDFTADEIYHLYKLRWQVELMFKTWKSVLNLDKVRQMKVERFKCYMISKLIWIMINWDIVTSTSTSILKKQSKLVSFYKCFALLKAVSNQLRKVLFAKMETKIVSWLKKVYKLIKSSGLKEARIGRADVKIILKAA
jgi:hypothetical protein